MAFSSISLNILKIAVAIYYFSTWIHSCTQSLIMGYVQTDRWQKVAADLCPATQL